jgi:hypothetical protein
MCVSPGCGDASCNVPGPHFPLSDTNQRICYGFGEELDCPDSTLDDYYGQDAQYGWDVSNISGARYNVSISGNSLVVNDNITELSWQGCTAGLSGGNCGSGVVGAYNWHEALEYCDGLEWGGYDDWRLPDKYELQSIVSYGTDSPSIYSEAFPSTPLEEFWTSTSYSVEVNTAWYVEFRYGKTWGQGVPKTNEYQVRCVRGFPEEIPERFSIDRSFPSEPVVLDSLTTFAWQGCPGGLIGELCVEDEASVEKNYAWKNALEYCESLEWAGYSDWRLPNITELQSIQNDTLYNASINDDIFPANPANYFWSSSTNTNSIVSAWSVNFYDGSMEPMTKDRGYSVRCIRQ